MMPSMVAAGLYQRSLRDDLRGVLMRSGLALLIGLVLLMVVYWAFPSLDIGTRAFTTAFVVTVIGICLFRAIVFRYVGNDIFGRRVLILGSGPMASQVEELRRKVDHQDMVLVGYISGGDDDAAIPSEKIFQPNSDLAKFATLHDVDELVVAIEPDQDQFPFDEVLDCKMRGIRICSLLVFFEEQTGKIKLDALTPEILLFSEGFIQAVLRGYVHRVFDVVASAAMLAVVWPLMLVTAAFIWLESGGNGPVLYRL